MEETKLTRRAWIVIVLLALMGQVAWSVENNFFNLFVQDAFGGSLADVALMVSASAITATVTTLVAGAWSDRVGKRKPFVVFGTVAWGLVIMAFAVLQPLATAIVGDAASAAGLGVALTVLFDCIMTFFGSLANDSAFNAWMTDISDDTNRGRVEGVNSAMPLLSMLLVFGGAMFLMTVNPDGTVTYDYQLFFVIIGVLVLLTALAAQLFMDDSEPAPTEEGSFLEQALYGFKPTSIAENPKLYLVLLGYCVFACSFQVFMPYYVLYLRLPYILGENYVLVMAPCIIAAAAFTIIYGQSMDKRGFASAIVIPLVIYLAGCVVLGVFSHPVPVFIGSLLMLSGYLGGAACFAAEVRNNTPLNHVGLYQGLRIFMVVLVPMLIGPWIGSTISAGSGSVVGFGVVGDGFSPSSLIFLGGAVVALLTFVVLAFLPRVSDEG